MKSQRGQGLIEIIFAVGVLVVVITAVVSLITKTTGLKTLSAQRKVANEMGNVVVEILIDKKNNDSANFWQLADITTPQTVAGYDGYQYTVDFMPVNSGNCSSTTNECANALITISWGKNQTLIINRFFSKKS